MNLLNSRRSNSPRPFSCENCGRQFSTSAYLSQHRRIHSGVKPYCCRFCDRKFTQLSHVQQHERIHTGEKPYSCLTCMKSFTQMSNLHSHQRQHMKAKPCKCPHCYMAFDGVHDLNSHIELRHPSNKYNKVLLCPICSKSYNSETYLAKHVQRHDQSLLLSKSPVRPCPQSMVQSQLSSQITVKTEMRLRSPTPPLAPPPSASQVTNHARPSGLTLDLILENLTSSACGANFASVAAANAWCHSWLPSASVVHANQKHTVYPQLDLHREASDIGISNSAPRDSSTPPPPLTPHNQHKACFPNVPASVATLAGSGSMPTLSLSEAAHLGAVSIATHLEPISQASFTVSQ